MPKLPVIHSVVSSDALAPLINELYEIEGLVECKFLTNGLNDTYLVTTPEEKYIYRIYKVNWRERSDIDFEVEMLNHLATIGIPVSFVRKKKDGQYLTEIDAPEGLRYAALFTFAEGEGSDSKENSMLYGEEVSKLHLALESFQSEHCRITLDLEHLLDEPLQKIRPFLSHRQDDMKYLEALSDLLKLRVLACSAKLNWGVCHGDLHGGNVYFREGGLTHFDFDCAGYGWRSYDIAVFQWAKVRGRSKDLFKNELWELFLESYQKHKALSDQDIDMVPVFVAIREIWLMGLHTGNSKVWGAAWQNDGYFNTNLQFLRDWCEVHSIN